MILVGTLNCDYQDDIIARHAAADAVTGATRGWSRSGNLLWRVCLVFVSGLQPGKPIRGVPMLHSNISSPEPRRRDGLEEDAIAPLHSLEWISSTDRVGYALELRRADGR
jgi:hypothetical protein